MTRLTVGGLCVVFGLLVVKAAEQDGPRTEGAFAERELVPDRALLANGVTVSEEGDIIRIQIQGRPFTEYHYKNVPRPFFYPVIGPHDTPMTRNWPMKEVAGEERDHIHHRGLWFTHGEVNGYDFWSENPKAGKIIHDRFVELKSGLTSGVLKDRNKWVTPDGKVICTDERTLRVYSLADARLFDLEITLFPADGDLTLGDTKEGTMAIRLAESMRLVRDKKPGLGHIVNSTGLKDGATWGKRADWVDYYGPVNDRLVGVAIFDHPDNPKHPTWWHVRDYGLVAANPFGVHDFESRPKGTGDVRIPAGSSVTFKYRFYIHEGNEKDGQVAERYQDYVKGLPKK
jgi:hypothetical protein